MDNDVARPCEFTINVPKLFKSLFPLQCIFNLTPSDINFTQASDCLLLLTLWLNEQWNEKFKQVYGWIGKSKQYWWKQNKRTFHPFIKILNLILLSSSNVVLRITGWCKSWKLSIWSLLSYLLKYGHIHSNNNLIIWMESCWGGYRTMAKQEHISSSTCPQNT